MKTLPGRVVVVDTGSWTIDIMPIENGKPNEAECITSQQGLIHCMRIINEECNRQIYYRRCLLFPLQDRESRDQSSQKSQIYTVSHWRDYEEKSVNKIFYDNDR